MQKLRFNTELFTHIEENIGELEVVVFNIGVKSNIQEGDASYLNYKTAKVFLGLFQVGFSG